MVSVGMKQTADESETGHRNELLLQQHGFDKITSCKYISTDGPPFEKPAFSTTVPDMSQQTEGSFWHGWRMELESPEDGTSTNGRGTIRVQGMEIHRGSDPVMPPCSQQLLQRRLARVCT